MSIFSSLRINAQAACGCCFEIENKTGFDVKGYIEVIQFSPGNSGQTTGPSPIITYGCLASHKEVWSLAPPSSCPFSLPYTLNYKIIIELFPKVGPPVDFVLWDGSAGPTGTKYYPYFDWDPTSVDPCTKGTIDCNNLTGITSVY